MIHSVDYWNCSARHGVRRNGEPESNAPSVRPDDGKNCVVESYRDSVRLIVTRTSLEENISTNRSKFFNSALNISRWKVSCDEFLTWRSLRFLRRLSERVLRNVSLTHELRFHTEGMDRFDYGCRVGRLKMKWNIYRNVIILNESISFIHSSLPLLLERTGGRFDSIVFRDRPHEHALCWSFVPP